MKVNIIIPFYKNKDTIVNLIRSLEDQDFKDFDATIVIDGEDRESYEFLLKEYFKEEKSTTAFPLYIEMTKENNGASAARNFGANISGDNLITNNKDNILFFLDADCELYPGMLRVCIEELEAKDIDFVYGNYRFDNKYEFVSNGFDPYLLETMNYIPTMSPVKRKVFNAINGFKDADYFQDWSFFHRASKAGFKGKYIKEFIFTTKMPGEDNISGNLTLSLDEKASTFRKLHNIEDKKLVVTTFAQPLQAIQRAKMLNADYAGLHSDSKRAVMPPNYSFKNWTATYMSGCFSQTIQALENHINQMIGRPIYHFVGTDVFQMFNNHPRSALRDFQTAFKEKNAVIFVNSPRCLDEMKQCGFDDAKLLYTPIYDIGRYVGGAMPNDFTVGVYYSDSNPMMMLDGGGGLSNLPLITDVARAMPTIKFKFFGGHAKYKSDDVEKKIPGNVEFCGRIPESKMVDFISSCSMIVRSTIHDGFPQLPIQFMLCGRQALVSCPDESMKFAEKLSFEEIFDNYDSAKKEVIEKIYKMKENECSLALKVDKIHSYYKKLMSEQTFVEEVHKCL